MKTADCWRVAVFDSKSYDEEFLRGALGERPLRLKFFSERLNADTVALAQGYDAVCAFVNDTLDAVVMDGLVAGGVRALALRCAGYNHVDLSAAFGRIHVVRVPAYSPHAVAEHALALIMALNRKTHRAYNRTRESNFRIDGLMGFDLNGKVAGVIGTGRIGKVLARILRGCGMEVLLYDPYPDHEFAAAAGCRYVDLPALLASAQVISLHCPLTPETKHLVRRETIEQMRPGVMLINTGRGGLIHTPDLVRALKSRQVGAAGLDVYEEEGDYFFEDFSDEGLSDDVLARLLTFPNVLVTSHQAFFTREALANIAETTLANLDACRADGPLENEVCYRCCEDGCRKQEQGRCF
ncbi:MAG: 2-hydroxyacid dehydrogenase [Candidatus Marinimicrobia bacterium]|nr:2-hydroxyacid dehydrogenase [Candidatus Neomarinimicrobiota bacterium]